MGLSPVPPADLFGTILSQDYTNEQKLHLILDLKRFVKKELVDLNEVPLYFQALNIAMDIPENGILSISFDVLCHLIKRVSIQSGGDNNNILHSQAYLILPTIIGRLGDVNTKSLAKIALEAYYLAAPLAVESAILNIGLTLRNILVIIESINHLTRIINVSQKFNISSFKPKLFNLLKTNNPNIYLSIEDLFMTFYAIKQNKYQRFDFEKELYQNNIPSDIKIELINKILYVSNHHLLSKENIPGISIIPSVESNIPSVESNIPSELSIPVSSISNIPSSEVTPELEKVLEKVNCKLDTLPALNIGSNRQLQTFFEDLLLPFNDRETEHNWSIREKNILKLRSLLRGNSSINYKQDLLHYLREFNDGFCKSMLSLRTTLSSNGCLLVKDCAIILGEDFDHNVDGFLSNLLKLCSATKQIASNNANMALCSLFVHLPFSHRFLQKFIIASNEKNVLPRHFSGIWTQIYILRFHDSNQFTSQHGATSQSGIDISCKVLAKILGDANPTVRQIAKECFWTFYSKFQKQADTLLSELEPKISKMLEKSKPSNISQQINLPTTLKKQRPSLKESIRERNKEIKLKQRSISTSSRSNTDTDLLNFEERPVRVPSRSTLAKNTTEVRSTVRSVSYPLVGNNARSDIVRQVKPPPKPPIEKFIFQNSRTESRKQSPQLPDSSPPKSSIQLSSEQDFKPSHKIHSDKDLFSDDSIAKPQQSQKSSFHFDDPKRISSNLHSDPILNYLLSDQIDEVKEGINLLRYAMMANENMPPQISPLLQKLSFQDPDMLRPLFSGSTVFKKSFKLFDAVDFLRVCSIIIDPFDENLVNSLMSLTDPDTLFHATFSLLSAFSNPDSTKDIDFVQQIYRNRFVMIRYLIKFLLLALDKLAIRDSSLLKITSHLIEHVHRIKSTKDFEPFSELVKKLHYINPRLFDSELRLCDDTTRREVEVILGTADDFMNFDISPSKDGMTKLIPRQNEKNEYTCSLTSKGFGTAIVVPDSSEDSIIVDNTTKVEDHMDVDNLHNDLNRLAQYSHSIIESYQDTEFDLKSQSQDEIQVESNINLSLGLDHQSNGLIDDFSLVKITEPLSSSKSDRNSLQRLIEKVDPLKSISSKTKHIDIFEDSTGSPQKVKEFSFSEPNWFNFQLSKLSLDDINDLDVFSVDNFKFLCKQISFKTILDDTFVSTLKYVQEYNLEPEFARYFNLQGKVDIENALWSYYNEYEKLSESQILSGLVILKLLLINKFSVDLISLWSILTELYHSYPLSSELNIAIGEVFDEMLVGLYSSKDLLSLSMTSFQNLIKPKSKSTSAILNCLLKVFSMNSVGLLVDGTIVTKVDKILHNFLNHDEVEIRRTTVEIYGKLVKASKFNLNGCSSTMNEVMNSLPAPQQKLISYYSE